MTDVPRSPRPVPAGKLPRRPVPAPRRVLVGLTPPPSPRLAARLRRAGPVDTVRVAANPRQFASAAALGWPDVVVTDTLTARTVAGLLLALRRTGTDVVRVATSHADTLGAVVAGLANPPAATPPPPAAGIRLTGRQLQVLELICDGLTNQQIADRLRLGPDTVKTHAARLRQVLAAPSRTGLAALAVATGLVRPVRSDTAAPTNAGGAGAVHTTRDPGGR